MPADVLTDVTIAQPVTSSLRMQPIRPTPPNGSRTSSRSRETPPPFAVGSRIAFVARFLRRRLAYTYEVIELVPGERLTMRTAQGPFPMETTYTWSPASRA